MSFFTRLFGRHADEHKCVAHPGRRMLWMEGPDFELFVDATNKFGNVGADWFDQPYEIDDDDDED